MVGVRREHAGGLVRELSQRVDAERARARRGRTDLPTTPQAATMNKLNTGGASAAHAERSGSPSKNGSPTAIAPARRNARRLITARRVKGKGLSPLPSAADVLIVTVHLRRACGTRRS